MLTAPIGDNLDLIQKLPVQESNERPCHFTEADHFLTKSEFWAKTFATNCNPLAKWILATPRQTTSRNFSTSGKRTLEPDALLFKPAANGQNAEYWIVELKF